MDKKHRNEIEDARVEGAEQAEPAVPKTGLALRVEQMDEREWTKWSIIAGVVLALISAAFLFLYPTQEDSMLPMGSLLALALALVLPNYAERRLERRAPKLRIALIITLGAAILVYLAVMLLTGGGASA